MVKKLAIYAFVILIVASFILTGCGVASVIDSKVKNAISGSSRSDEAIEWLIANKEMIIPELVNRVSNSTSRKSNQAAQALLLMGECGRSGVIKLFDTMSEEGRNIWCTVLSEQRTKQAVIELLIISTHVGSFERAVSSLIVMGDVSLNYLAGQLHIKTYQQTVDTVLANFGEKAVDLIIPAVHSSDKEKANRALVILATVGESASSKLAIDALNNSSRVDEAVKIANTMLKSYPQTTISAIMSAVDKDTDEKIAAALLYEISKDDNIAMVLTQSGLGDADKTSIILQEYVKLCGVSSVLQLALGGDSNTAQGAMKALSGGDYDKEVLIALLSNINAADIVGSSTDNLVGSLIVDESMKKLAHSIIATDAESFVQISIDDMQLSDMGFILSSASENDVIYDRLVLMMGTLSGENKMKMLSIVASCYDVKIPTIALMTYAAGGEDGDLAAQALTTAASANGKFLFTDVDMMPYAAKIIESLSSSDSLQKSYAQIILSRISTAKSTNSFYATVFESYKDSTIFSILAGQYGGAGALPLDLSIDVDGTQVAPKTISIEKTGDAKNVSSSNEPDYTSLLSGFAPYLGWSEVESGAEIEIKFDCDITPKSKRYSGLLSGSYLGAEATGTLTVYINGEKVKTSIGHALILPPTDYPGPAGEFRYLSDASDAPIKEVYDICFINAMYSMWGEKVLFGFYNYDLSSTNQAVGDLLEN